MKSTILRTILALTTSFVFFSAPMHAQVPGTISGFVTTSDGIRIHYIEAGTSHLGIRPSARTPPTFPSPDGKDAARTLNRQPSLLFIPGWTMPGWIWEKQIEYFSRNYHVVAIDPRSQGQSTHTSEGLYPAARARDIKAVIDKLGLHPVVLIGWSMAVGEVAAYVDQFGTTETDAFGASQIAGLVLVDDSTDPLDPENVKDMLDFIAGFIRNDRVQTTDFVKSWFKQPQSEEYLNRVIAASLETPSDTAAALLVSKFSSDYTSALAKITRPTLVCGAESPYLRLVQSMQAKIAGARLEIFPGTGHALFVDDPAHFNSVLNDFLKHLSP